MKYIVSILFTVICLTGYSQTTSLPLGPDGLIAYVKVVHLKDSLAKKEQLYDLTMKWFSNYYKRSVVLTNDNLNNHLIVETKALKTGVTINLNTYKFGYKVEIIFKDGRYKYKVYDIRWEFMGGNEISPWYSDYKAGGLKPIPFATKNKLMRYTSDYFDGIDKNINAAMDNLEATLNNDRKQKLNNDF